MYLRLDRLPPLHERHGERDVIDQTTLPWVVMQNRNGFTPDPRPDVGRPAPKKT